MYGVVEGHPTYDVMISNFAPYAKLGRNMLRAGFFDGMRLAFGPPEWRPASLGGPVHIPEPEPGLRFSPPVSRGVQRYVVAWFIPMSAVIFAMLWFAETADVRWMWLGGVFVVATQISQSALLHGWKHARLVEALRLLAIIPGLLVGAAF